MTLAEELEHDEVEAEATGKLHKVINFFPGFYSEKKQAEIPALKGLDRLADISDNGVPMIYVESIKLKAKRTRSQIT